MFPGRGREGHSRDFGTLRLATQRYDWESHSVALSATVTNAVQHGLRPIGGDLADSQPTRPPANCVSVASKGFNEILSPLDSSN